MPGENTGSAVTLLEIVILIKVPPTPPWINILVELNLREHFHNLTSGKKGTLLKHYTV